MADICPAVVPYDTLEYSVFHFSILCGNLSVSVLVSIAQSSALSPFVFAGTFVGFSTPLKLDTGCNMSPQSDLRGLVSQFQIHCAEKSFEHVYDTQR